MEGAVGGRAAEGVQRLRGGGVGADFRAALLEQSLDDRPRVQFVLHQQDPPALEHRGGRERRPLALTDAAGAPGAAADSVRSLCDSTARNSSRTRIAFSASQRASFYCSNSAC